MNRHFFQGLHFRHDFGVVLIGVLISFTELNAGTWRLVEPQTTEELKGIWGSSSTSIWCVGTAGYVGRWNGTNWSNQNLGISFSAITGIDEHNVWIGGNQSILKLEGQNWVSTNFTATDSVLGIWAANLSNIWAVGGSQGYIWKSAGAGGGWNTIEGPTSGNRYYRAIHGTSVDSVWAVGNEASGSPILGSAPITVNAVWAGSPSSIWIIGDNGRIQRFNGSSWEIHSSGTSQSLRGIYGVGINNVWAVGRNGTIVHWDGVSWSVQNSGTLAHLNSVWSHDAETVWAVGSAGTVLTTSESASLGLLSITCRNRSLTSGGASVQFGAPKLHELGESIEFVLKNIGASTVTEISAEVHNDSHNSFVVTAPATAKLKPNESTTFRINYLAHSDLESATVIVSGTGATSTFEIPLVGRLLNSAFDTDDDGMSDLVEFHLSEFGFDWTENQSLQVQQFISKLKSSGFYQLSDLQAIKVGSPLIEPLAGSKTFRLRWELQHSRNLEEFDRLPATIESLSIGPAGEIQMDLNLPESPSFIRIQSH
jgi:hypothetical protein